MKKACILIIVSLIGLFSCSKIKNESVKVNTPYPESFEIVIEVDNVGKYSIHIPNESERTKVSQLIPKSVSTSDSIWAVQLADIDTCIKAYKKAATCNDVKINVEADSQAEYKSIKKLMEYLQDTGYHSYYLTTVH